MATCVRCGVEVEKPTKEWDMHPKKSPPMRAQEFVCGKCGRKFRKLTPLSEMASTA